jgi:hypothetical protein
MIINEKLQGSLVRFAQHILVQVATKYMYIYIFTGDNLWRLNHLRVTPGIKMNQHLSTLRSSRLQKHPSHIFARHMNILR